MEWRRLPAAALLALVALTAVCAPAAATTFSSCAEPKDPVAVRVRGCERQPCKLPKGRVASMEVDFEVDEDVAQLDTAVTAYALGAKIDFPLKQKNACLSLTNAECPLDRYELVTYGLELELDASYPSISLNIDIALKDKNKRQFTCFKLYLQVVDPTD